MKRKTLTVHVPVPIRVRSTDPVDVAEMVQWIQDVLGGGMYGGELSVEVKTPSKVKIRQAYHAALREQEGK